MQAPLRIIAGLHNFAISSGREQIRLAPTVLKHEDYIGDVAPFDIALLGVETPLTFVVDVIGRIQLPQPGFIPTGDVRLFGWGSVSRTHVHYIPDILQTVTKDLMSVDICREVLRNRYPLGTPIHSTHICTGPLNTVVTACSGDSGSPIVQVNDGGDVSLAWPFIKKYFIDSPLNPQLTIVGIAAWVSEFPCGAINAVTVYTRVSAFNDWIVERTGPL